MSKEQKMTYRTKGTCAREISFEVVDGKLHNVSFFGGCHGNLQGIAKLVEGMSVEEAVSRLEGICCGMKSTSCPDQLAQAIKSYAKNN